MKANYHIKSKEKQTYLYTSSENQNAERNYYYSYSYDYEWVDKEENILDSCIIDLRKELRLTSKKIELIQGNKRNSFSLDQIRNITVSYRYVMLPIIIGGILAPFSLISIFGNNGQGWESIIGLFTGIMLLYYGFNGSHQLVIELPNTTFTMFIGDEKEKVQMFIDRLKV